MFEPAIRNPNPAGSPYFGTALYSLAADRTSKALQQAYAGRSAL
jgi:hypothetical protein